MNDRELPSLNWNGLPAFLESASAWIDRALRKALPDQEPRALLYDLVRDYPGRGGKRFRPALMLLTCQLAGGNPERVLPTAVALELFHSFALVHDDIEDGSLIRRGQPALHRLHGLPLALNAGDTLFALTYETLRDNVALLGADLSWRVFGEFQAAVRRTLEGQAFDIGWIARDHLPSRAEYENMIRLKTGWYSGRGPCQIGALIAGAPRVTAGTLGNFGERLGIGFQIRDDWLNLTADSEGRAPAAQGGGYGKERGGDIAEGKRTLIVIELLERLPPDEAKRLGAILTAPPEQTGSADIAWVIGRAGETGALEAVRKRAEALAQEAETLLEQFPASPARELLRELTRYLVSVRAA
jgi:geranylgeranyl diphosphate synthase type II